MITVLQLLIVARKGLWGAAAVGHATFPFIPVPFLFVVGNGLCPGLLLFWKRNTNFWKS